MMRSAGSTRLHFEYTLPSGRVSGTGVASTAIEPGYLVLDDVRTDDGKEWARVWVPLPLDGVLYARELGDDAGPVLFEAGAEPPAVGSVVCDRDGLRWRVDSLDGAVHGIDTGWQGRKTWPELLNVGAVQLVTEDDERAGR